jgi:hypothetical protein
MSLSAALTVLARAEANEHLMHADVSAFGAPSECHELVSRGESKRGRLARRIAHSRCQLSYGAMVRKARKHNVIVFEHNNRAWSRLLNECMKSSGYFS